MAVLWTLGAVYATMGIFCAAYYWRRAWRTNKKARGHDPEIGPLLSLSLAILLSWPLFVWSGSLNNFSMWEK